MDSMRVQFRVRGLDLCNSRKFFGSSLRPSLSKKKIERHAPKKPHVNLIFVWLALAAGRWHALAVMPYCVRTWCPAVRNTGALGHPVVSLGGTSG